MIEMKGISKTYRVRRREAGLGNAVRSLFSREYTEIPALKSMSFTIPDGQIVGYIGPNGAGKSTTIECILGTKQADSGEVSVLGLHAKHDRRKLFQEVGGQFQEGDYQSEIKVFELCEEIACLYKNPAD